MGEDQVGLWWVSGGDRGKLVVGFGRSTWVILVWVSLEAWFKWWDLFGVGCGVDICYPMWWKSVWSCGGCGIVIGSNGSVNGFFFFFGLAGICGVFWFGLMVFFNMVLLLVVVLGVCSAVVVGLW